MNNRPSTVTAAAWLAPMATCDTRAFDSRGIGTGSNALAVSVPAVVVTWMIEHETNY